MSTNTPMPLLTAFQSGNLILPNRIVMASLTRARADNPELAPTALHAAYYAQRASAGLIISESTWVSPEAPSYIHIPGIYSQAQIRGWKTVTDAVHAKGGQIFLQLVHSGAVTHPDLFNGRIPSGPSAINPQEKVYTPQGFKDTVIPKAFTVAEIQELVQDFKRAAYNAKQAGFDGVELHAQLFTLIPQFLSKATNQRTDDYGGSIPNRVRLLFEILDALIVVYGPHRVGVKFTPAAFNPGIIRPDEETLPAYEYILQQLNKLPLAYVQLTGPSVPLKDTVLAPLENNFFPWFRERYTGTLMVNRGFNRDTANDIIQQGGADLVSFGSAYVGNPDLKERFAYNLPLNTPDPGTYYGGGEKGYTDYPFAVIEHV